MNEVQAMVFGQNNKWYLLTEALNSCFAVWVISPLASVGAHIPPHPGPHDKDPQAGDKNVVAKMKEIADKYKQQKHLFDADFRTALVYARIEGKTALPDKKDFMEKCLRRFGVDIAMQAYDIKLPGEPRDDHHGTSFVYATPSQGAYFILQDEVKFRIYPRLATSQAQASTNPTPATEYHANPIFPREPVSGSQGAITSSTAKASPPAPNIAKKTPERRPFKDLRYVKSQPSSDHSGARIVRTDQGNVLFKAELWKKEKDESSGTKEYWVCRKHKLYTDL